MILYHHSGLRTSMTISIHLHSMLTRLLPLILLLLLHSHLVDGDSYHRFLSILVIFFIFFLLKHKKKMKNENREREESGRRLFSLITPSTNSKTHHHAPVTPSFVKILLFLPSRLHSIFLLISIAIPIYFSVNSPSLAIEYLLILPFISL